MWLIMLILLVALIGVFWKRREIGASANPIMAVLAVVTILVSLSSLFGGRRSGAVQVEADFYRAVGAKIGQALAADFPEGGTVLVLHAGRINATFNKMTSAYLEGMKKGFGPVAFQIVEEGPSPDNPDSLILMEHAIPPTVVTQRMQQLGGLKAVVSFIGPPEAVGPRPANWPAFYVGGQVDTEQAERLLNMGWVKAAVCYRENVDWNAQPPRRASDDEIFNIRYVLRRAGS